MKVVATAKGYYGSKVREPGEEFGLSDDAHFSATWMVPADGAAMPKPKKAQKAHVKETEVLPPADPAPSVDPVTGDEI